MRAALLALALAAGAAAQPVAPEAAPERPLSPTHAVQLSLATPAALIGLGLSIGADAGPLPAALVATGVFVGPSAGTLAQGAWRSAAVGTGLRLLGASVAGVGVAALTGSTGGDGRAVVGAAAIVGGAGLFASGVVFDLRSAAQNARPGAVEVAPGGAGLAVRVAL